MSWPKSALPGRIVHGYPDYRDRLHLKCRDQGPYHGYVPWVEETLTSTQPTQVQIEWLDSVISALSPRVVTSRQEWFHSKNVGVDL